MLRNVRWRTGNALRHNAPGGRVEVITGTRNSRTVLSVSNTGPVVPDTAVDRLLQPFQRLGTDRTSHGDGLGLPRLARLRHTPPETSTRPSRRRRPRSLRTTDVADAIVIATATRPRSSPATLATSPASPAPLASKSGSTQPDQHPEPPTGHGTWPPMSGPDAPTLPDTVRAAHRG